MTAGLLALLGMLVVAEPPDRAWAWSRMKALAGG
jgi:hypothetical protein